MEKIKILFVCMGNICRSPTAEGVFRKLILEKNLEQFFEIDSAGTHSYHIGSSPDSRTQVEAKKHNVDLSNLRARQVCDLDFEYYDYIIAMDSSNYYDLMSQCPREDQTKISMMLKYIPNTQIESVPDPYFDGGFDRVFSLLDDASKFFLDELKKKHKFN
jgi:protein-tyrosine phosphatase